MRNQDEELKTGDIGLFLLIIAAIMFWLVMR